MCRNLFFRIWHLQQHGIRPVFVIEGEAPELKLETMARRQQARFGGAPAKGAYRAKGKRSHFKIWLREVSIIHKSRWPCESDQQRKLFELER